MKKQTEREREKGREPNKKTLAIITDENGSTKWPIERYVGKIGCN